MHLGSIDISVLVGKTVTAIERNCDDSELVFVCSDGTKYKMYHNQDCCEGVNIDDICGDLQDLVGTPILTAYKSSNVNEDPTDVTVTPGQDSFEWTFYRFSTAKGSVVIRWYGESNGYYSTSVQVDQIA